MGKHLGTRVSFSTLSLGIVLLISARLHWAWQLKYTFKFASISATAASVGWAKKIDAQTAVTEFVVIPASSHSNSKQKGQQWATFLALIHVIQNNYGNDFVSDTFSFMWFVESRLNCKTVQCHNGFTIPTERITVLYKYSNFFFSWSWIFSSFRYDFVAIIIGFLSFFFSACVFVIRKSSLI